MAVEAAIVVSSGVTIQGLLRVSLVSDNIAVVSWVTDSALDDWLSVLLLHWWQSLGSEVLGV